MLLLYLETYYAIGGKDIYQVLEHVDSYALIMIITTNVANCVFLSEHHHHLAMSKPHVDI